MFKFFVLLSLIFSCTNAYEYYMLALQDWCETSYDIHGLWPQYNATSWPEYCEAPAYKEITNATLLAEMNAEWANCSNPPASLWEHEYTRHLSCILQQYPGVYTQDSVFQLVLDLYAKTPISEFCNGSSQDCYACYGLDFRPIPCPVGFQ